MGNKILIKLLKGLIKSSSKKLSKLLFNVSWEFYLFIEMLPKRILGLFGKGILSWREEYDLTKGRTSSYSKEQFQRREAARDVYVVIEE